MLRVLTVFFSFLPVRRQSSSASICETMSWATRNSTSVSSIGLSSARCTPVRETSGPMDEVAEAILSISSM